MYYVKCNLFGLIHRSYLTSEDNNRIFAFHKSSTKPKYYTNFSQNHNMHSWLQRSLVNLEHRESLLTFTCITSNESILEDECHLLFTCSAYSAIRSRYVDILRGSVNLSAILKTTPRRFSSMSMLYSRVHCSMYFNVWIPFLGKRNISRTCKLAKIDLFMDDKKF